MEEKNTQSLTETASALKVRFSHLNRIRSLREFTRTDNEFTWEQAVRVINKNSRFGVLVGAASLSAVLTVVLFLRSTYQPVARVEIAPPASGVRTLQEVESPAEAENQDYLETQAQILRSDALAVSVIRQLKLDENLRPENPKASKQGETGGNLSDRFRSANKPYFREQVELATLTPAEAEALEKFRRSLSVNPLHNTRLVEVSFASNDPQVAQQATNAVVFKFIENGVRQRYDSTTQASEWLSTQLEGLRGKGVSAREAVSSYQREHGLVEVDERDVPLSQFMSETNHQLSEAQATRIENEAYLRMMKQGEAENIPLVRSDPVYQDLLLRYDDLRAKLAQARTVYGDANSNVKKLEQELAELDRQRDEERKRVGDRIRTAFAAALERERLMLQQRDKLHAQMVNADSQMVGYHILKNEAVANAELYNTLQARLKEAGIYAGLGSNNIRIVDLAQNLHRPSGPHRVALLTAGAAASMLLGLFACFVKESMSNTLRTPEDVALWTGLKSLALLPAITATTTEDRAGFWEAASSSPRKVLSNDRVALMQPLTVGAEAMRELRTAILSRPGQRDPAVIVVSSALEGEGKTTVAINLAAALAQLGKTCLIDADLRQSSVASAFELKTERGLAQVLSNGASLRDAMINVDTVPGLHLVAAGSPASSPADILASAQMEQILAQLRSEFEFVVIDTPPVIYFSDARELSRFADQVILVCRYGVTTRRAIQRSAELLQDVKAPIAGVVLNAIDYSSPDYHYFTYGYRKTPAGRNYVAQALLQANSSSAVSSESDSNTKSKSAHA